MYSRFSFFFPCTLVCLSSNVFANSTESLNKQTDSLINNPEVIEVIGVRERLSQQGLLKDSIVKTELITESQIKANQAANLSDAIANSIGIRVSNECSMCGAKRVMINGLKGEHTNVLVDGIPLHTMLSGFYGMDAVAMSGVGQIEVARGAGASLTAPEAIGGTINLVTAVPSKDEGELDVAIGTNGYKKLAALRSFVPKEKNMATSVIIQVDERAQFDGDGNGVSETPQMENQSFTSLFSYEYDLDTNFRVRFNHTKSEVFGGPILGGTVGSIQDVLDSVSEGESSNLFYNGHVNGRYIGHPWETAEWVKTQRNELMASVLRDFNTRFNGAVSLATVSHKQVSFYEGIDYDAKDDMHYADFRFNYDVSPEHLLTFGLDYRDEEMRSHSNALEHVDKYVSDSFDYLVKGIYVQDTWMVNPWLEISSALRVDRISADFIDPTKPGVEISKTLVSPRLDSRLFHNDELTSRISIGQGYRAPLSFFESDHGILDAEKGYLVEVSQPERSTSVNYSLNFESEIWLNTTSIAYTRVKNLATLEHDDAGTPVLAQLDQTASVLAMDISVSYQLNQSLNVTAAMEMYKYNDTFKSSFAIAPVEKRATMSLNWQHEQHTFNSTVVLISNRDLSKYGYHGYEDKLGTMLKPIHSPTFSTTDFKYQYAWSKAVTFYVGANNVFNYNQAKDESSPLLFDADGGYDVTYIYGPMRGRTWYTGFDWDF